MLSHLLISIFVCSFHIFSYSFLQIFCADVCIHTFNTQFWLTLSFKSVRRGKVGDTRRAGEDNIWRGDKNGMMYNVVVVCKDMSGIIVFSCVFW